MTDDIADRLHRQPVDEQARAALAERGLVLRTVPAADDGFGPWLQSVGRGFLEADRTDEQVDATRERARSRRNVGVYDPAAPMADTPVGTFASWGSHLTVPGGSAIAVSAVSAVTVAQTHHRQGIARAMMEGELRAAASAGAVAAVLTVSEATLYGRYGFGSAAFVTGWRIEPRRAGWIGPIAPGRVDFVSRAQARELAPALHERVRRRWPGELEMPEGHWDRFFRVRPDAERPGELRTVRYATADGDVTGLAAYTATEDHDDYTKSRVHVVYLLAADDEAYAGLWRYLLTLDLIGEVTASELSIDEPLRWMIADQRAATVTGYDHHYVRILDVPAALTARRYEAPGVLALDVADPIGIGGGRWILTVDAQGHGAVTAWTADAPPDGAIELRLGTTELSAAYLGSVSLATLAAAGRAHTTDAAAAGRMLSWHVPARLSFWY